MNTLRNIKQALFLSHPFPFTQSILPAIVASCIAVNYHSFAVPMFILAILGITIAHCTFNAACQYHSLPNNQINKKQTRQLTIILFILLFFITIIIFTQQGPTIWVMLAAAIILAIIYSIKNIKRHHKFLSALLIGIIFGPILMLALQQATTGVITLANTTLSLTIALLIIQMTFAHSLLHQQNHTENDTSRPTNKNITFCLTLLLTIIPFILIILGICLKVLHPVYIVTFFSLPIAISLIHTSNSSLYRTSKPIKIKPLMGPLPHLQQNNQTEINHHLLQWLLARNLFTYFTTLIIVINIALLLFT